MYNCTCIIFRTCVDETQLCKGKAMCVNKNDLKWCKDVWELPSLNFTNIVDSNFKEHFKCTKRDQIENFVPNGQDIFEEDIGNGLFYNCFNRADENPFKKTTYNQSEDDTWSNLVRTPCQSNNYRRCLGQKPSQCVYISGRYM